MVWTCSRNWKKKNSFEISLGNPEGKRPLGRQRHRQVDNVSLRYIGWAGMAQDKDQ
jgi:hypothetical protein